MNEEKIKQMVDEMIKELQSRGGFDGWWDEIDDDTKDDIVSALIAIAIDYAGLHAWGE